MATYYWHRYSAAEGFERITQGENPWVALGDFLDDWRRSQHEDCLALVEQPLCEATTVEEERWAALFATVVEQLCTQDNLLPPSWVMSKKYYLADPWYPDVKTERLRRLYEETTPEIFKKHNILAGDRLLQRM